MRLLLAVLLGLLPLAAHAAPQLRTLARFVPAKGLVSDAALLGNGHIALAYPEFGVIADYSPDGKLTRHVMREAGVRLKFTPTACIAAADEGLIVFDEAENHVFKIALDGNVSKGLRLGLPGAGGPQALTRLAGLSLGADGSLWASSLDNGLLGRFDKAGKLLESIRFADLPSSGLYTRGQVAAGGEVFVLDYKQGAVLYRLKAGEEFRRVRLVDDDPAFGALPGVQDFAVRDDLTILAATTDPRRPLLLLSRGAKGYSARPLTLQLGASRRLSVRASRGKFIVWASDTPLVYVLQLD